MLMHSTGHQDRAVAEPINNAERVPFEDDYKAAAQGVRAAMTDLLASAGLGAFNSRELARHLGLNKNLTWKLSKIINGSDLYAAAQHIPGSAGMKLMLNAMRKAGAPSASIETAKAAIRNFERVVEVHTGDRATLEQMLANLAARPTRTEHLLQNRKQAYQGNSGTYGVRAKAQMAANILAPAATEGNVDVLQVAGVVGLRRLRHDARWLLFRRSSFNDDGTRALPADGEALDPRHARGIPLLADYCTDPIPKLEIVRTDQEAQYELPPGPVGNTAAMNLIYGVVMRDTASIYRDEHNQYAELFCSVSTPAELLQFDLIVHEDFEWAMAPEPLLLNRMDGSPSHLTSGRERNLLPFTETVQELGRGVSRMSSAHLPWYTKLLSDVFERAGWDSERFVGFRLTMPFPPIPSQAMLRAPLPERPA